MDGSSIFKDDPSLKPNVAEEYGKALGFGSPFTVREPY
jgi:hypothetical protein